MRRYVSGLTRRQIHRVREYAVAKRRMIRIAGTIGSIALIALIVIVVAVLSALPSMSDLQDRYFSSRIRKPVSTTQPIAMQLRSQTEPSVSAATLSMAEIPQNSAPSPQPPATSLADYAVARFVERGDTTLRVCDSLTSPQNAPPVDTGSFGRAIESEINGNQPNPYAEAAMAPLGALLRLPSVGAVATQLRDSQESGDVSLIRQAQFYSNVAFAAAEMYRNKASIDMVSQHAYHLSVLSKLANLAPSAPNQPEFADLCDVAEARAMDPSSSSIEMIDEEKSQLLDLIGALGLAPQQVGFDPAMNASTSISITPQAVTVMTPWMNAMYGSGLQISGQAPQSQQTAQPQQPAR